MRKVLLKGLPNDSVAEMSQGQQLMENDYPSGSTFSSSLASRKNDRVSSANSK